MVVWLSRNVAPMRQPTKIAASSSTSVALKITSLPAAFSANAVKNISHKKRESTGERHRWSEGQALHSAKGADSELFVLFCCSYIVNKPKCGQGSPIAPQPMTEYKQPPQGRWFYDSQQAGLSTLWTSQAQGVPKGSQKLSSHPSQDLTSAHSPPPPCRAHDR